MSDSEDAPTLVVSVQDEEPLTVEDLRAELERIRNLYEVELADARMMARGWRHNNQLIMKQYADLTLKLRHVLQRVGEFLRFFGPLPFNYYTGEDWQVVSDYLPDQDESMRYYMDHSGEAPAEALMEPFWRGVFRERARQGLF